MIFPVKIYASPIVKISATCPLGKLLALLSSWVFEFKYLAKPLKFNGWINLSDK